MNGPYMKCATGGHVTQVAAPTPPANPGISRGLVLLFALACGVAVANLYYAQPVLSTVAHTFGASYGAAGLIVTFSQIGYAVGLALLVPLGDLVSRRRLVPAVLTVTSLALLASALAPSISLLATLALIVGAGSVVAQVLVPMAAGLADDVHRGQIVGSVMTGLLLGILLARTVSGVIADLAGWRVVYFTAAAMTITLAALLARRLPREGNRPHIAYRTLLHSTVELFLTQPRLRRRALYGALGFATFSIFWTTVAFLLSGAPYHYNDLTIGLFGLCGAAGALCANFAGRWVDRGLHHHTTLLFAALVALSFLLLWLGRTDLAMLIAGIVVLDAGVQGLQVTNQSIIYGLAPQAHSRINSAYMVCYFVGGALGSAAASAIYDSSHWAGICVLGAALGIVATALAVYDHLTRNTPATDQPAGAEEMAGAC
jgi:predicted MFS family arabinose efflux permease